MDRGRITLYVAASLDGFIATEDGGVSWLEPYQGAAESDGSYEAFFAEIDCLVMGSNTYEQVLEFGEWPYDETPTYVFTSRDLPLATDRVELVAGEVGDVADELARRHDGIWLVGGGQLVRAFLDAGLIDEIRLSVIPLLLGRGIPLFGAPDERHELTLRGATTDSSGIVELRYDVRPE